MVDITYSGPTYKLSLWGGGSHDYEFSEYVKSIVCYNQGEFIQYSFLAAEFHKCMKDAQRDGNLDLAKESQAALVTYLNRNLERVTEKNFEYLHSHFKRRTKNSPRICVKAAYYDIGNNESVISLFRDANVNYKSDCLINENTGFKYIHDTGRPYICNNIPEKARVGEYINPRLNIDAVKLYQIPGFIKTKLGLSDGEDEAWQKCWVPTNGQCLTGDSCYKSTLIIPMTLWNNSLDENYRELINLQNVDRTIFGFLCIDSINTDYFIPDIDIPLCYAFADLLSLYLMSRAVYTEISDTFKSVGKCSVDITTN